MFLVGILYNLHPRWHHRTQHYKQCMYWHQNECTYPPHTVHSLRTQSHCYDARTCLMDTRCRLHRRGKHPIRRCSRRLMCYQLLTWRSATTQDSRDMLLRSWLQLLNCTYPPHNSRTARPGHHAISRQHKPHTDADRDTQAVHRHWKTTWHSLRHTL
jgi:hypothetical protein